jgi:nitrite reductase/ring-hydroxylating ferredoxin subunit
MSPKKTPFLTRPSSAYYHREIPEDDRELTRVGPGTPAGEYLRRFWHPIAYTSQVKDVPLALKIMGEDLVLFRDKSGQLGLIEAHCPHRGTSFEYGKIEERGIRCCYHSWLIDVDGKILETPGEPEDSTLKDRLYHGAYPVRDFRGLIFGYMGPPEKTPEFPRLDIFEAPGRNWEVGAVEGGTGSPTHLPCNWLQDVDNFVDIQHEEFVHSTISGIQFLEPSGRPLEELAIIGQTEYLETPIGILTLAARRVRPETVWVRNIEFVWPNIAILGRSILMDHQWGTGETEVHCLPRLAWVVPIDDTNHMMLDMVHMPIGETFPPALQGGGVYPSPSTPKSYDDMQRMPGDYEAQVNQRPIAVHALEHLGATDRGITMMRKGLRRRIRMVQRGEDPPELAVLRGKVVPTHGGDTLLRMRQAPTTEQDKKLLQQAVQDLGRRYLQSPPNVVTLER